LSALCWGCKRFRDAAVTDGADRSYCADCAGLLPSSREMNVMAFLANTVPYGEGDIVSCKTGGEIYDGIGHVVRVSFDPMDLASPIMPMFLVAMDEKAYDGVPDEIWFSEVCLEPVTANV
jgi:hypothetical protein